MLLVRRWRRSRFKRSIFCMRWRLIQRLFLRNFGSMDRRRRIICCCKSSVIFCSIVFPVLRRLKPRHLGRRDWRRWRLVFGKVEKRWGKAGILTGHSIRNYRRRRHPTVGKNGPMRSILRGRRPEEVYEPEGNFFPVRMQRNSAGEEVGFWVSTESVASR